ncbi:MAG TPA: hypothetical protein DCE39_06970 [Planctomycetaceae bacterium]|nr:hypothetical protein [Planctomycetaceae bacterium]
MAPRASVVEQLEDRTLLSSVVIESVNAGEALSIDTQAMVGNGTLSNPEYDSLVIRSVEVAPDTGTAIDIDFSGDDTAKLQLDSISIQSVIATGDGDAGIRINLQDVDVEDLVVDSSSISGENGAGLSIGLHDVNLGALTILRSEIAGDGGAGTRVSLDGTAVGAFNIAKTTSDGVSVTSVSGESGVIDPAGGVTNTSPMTVTALTHGLSTGDVIEISGVIGNSAVNGKRVITRVNDSTFTVDSTLLNGAIDSQQTTLTVQDVGLLRTASVFPFPIGIGAETLQVLSAEGNVLTVSRGASPTAHGDGSAVFATAANGDYIRGGEWVVRSSISNGSITENRLEGATGSDGLQLDLANTSASKFSVSDNYVIEGLEIVLDGAPLQNLTVHNNLLTGNDVGPGLVLDATDSNVDLVLSTNRVVGNATNGVQFDFTDSNLGGRIIGNTVEDNAGDGMVFNADATVGLRTLNFSSPGTFVGEVSGASNHEPIRISSQGHGLKRGDLVYIDEVRGNIVANGTHHVAVPETALETSLNLLQTDIPVDDVGSFLLIESPISSGESSQGTVATNMLAGDTTVSVNDASVFDGSANFVVRIESEFVVVTDVDTTNNILTVIRGQLGTSAVQHAVGVQVTNEGLYDFQVRVDDERMQVVEIDESTNVFSVLRGVDSTVAASHLGTSTMYHDSVFLLEGASGSGSNTGIYSGGGKIHLADGAISGNTFLNNTVGAGVRAELPENTVLRADLTDNTVSGNAQGGFILRASDTNPEEHGASAFAVNIGGEDRLADANLFDGNLGAGMAFTLVDKAVGTFNVRNNTVINMVDDGDTSTNYVGDAIHAELVGQSLDFEAINRLEGAVIENNSLGTVGYTELASAINSTQATITVTDSARFGSLAFPFNVQIGREQMTVTGITDANLEVTRGVGGSTGESHVAGDTLFATTGGNAGRGFSLLIEEDSTLQDLLFRNNTVVNNADDGFKLRREDEGRLNLVETDGVQRRAVTIRDNTIIGNASNAPPEPIGPGVPDQRRGAGIDIHALNGSVDLQDLEIVGNVIEANVGPNTSGVLLRAEADARILADIEDNRIRYNEADGIELSTRENDQTDVRQVGGTWVKNTITDNGGHGIEIIGRHGLFDVIAETVDPDSAATVQTPLFIGIEGNDPVDGKDRGNVIESNGLDGMTVNSRGAISFANNSVRDNRTGGIDISPDGPQITAIKSSEISENFGIGIDVNASPQVIVTIRDNLIRNNIDSDLSDGVADGDAIELSTPGVTAGPLHVTVTGNFIEGNDGRGIDLLNVGTTQLKIGDPTLPLDTGRNEIVGNRLEGIYVVNTADVNQSQTVPSTVALQQGGDVDARGNIMLHVDTNTIEDNGLGSSFAGTGLIIRAGTVFGGGSDHRTRDGSGDLARRGGEGFSNQTGVGSNDGSVGAGNGRINARIANNAFEGNFGNDFYVEAFRSTVDPETTTGTWTTEVFNVTSYDSDPLSRVNMVFTGNSGNGLSAAVAGRPVYSNDEQDFKRRTTGKSPAGPWGSGELPRNACRVPVLRNGSAPVEPEIGPEFLYPGLSVERTWRVLLGFDTVGAGPFDEFSLGTGFEAGLLEPLDCGWDIMGPASVGGMGWGGTTLDSFVSEKTTKVTVVDPAMFTGGDPRFELADGFTFQVGLEEMRARRDDSDSSGATFDVDRGWRNTPVSAHAAGTPVGLFTFGDPLTATFPLPDVVDVTPTIRNSDAGVIEFTFSEDMKNVAIDDFALAFDDGNALAASHEWTTGVITGASHIRPDGTKQPVTITSIGVGGEPSPNDPNVLINPRLSEGDEVTISGILGNGAANGVYTVSNLQANSFDLGVNETQSLQLIGGPDDGTFTLSYQDAVNEIQRIEMAGHAFDGHFALGFRPPAGGETEFTDPIEFDATADTIQAALESVAVPTLDAGDVRVTGGPLAGVNEIQEVQITGAAFGGDVITLTYLHPATILTTAIDDQVGTIEVNEVEEFRDPYGNPLSVPFLIRIDDEQMRVTDVVGDDLTVDRAFNGTVAASHRRRAKVREVQTTIPIPTGSPTWGAQNEVQRLRIDGASPGESFTLSFLHPDTQPGLVAGQFNGQLTTVEFEVEDYAAMTDAFGKALPTGVLAGEEQYYIRVEGEEMRVVAVSGTAGGPHTLTVERAINGTDAAIHDAGVEVFYVETTEAIEYNAPADDSRNELQRITMLGDPDGGFFTLTFQHPESIPTTLDGAVGTLTDTLVVDDVGEMTDGFGRSLLAVGEFNIRVNLELMRVISIDEAANSLEVERGINGTSAGIHLDGAEVFEVETTRQIAFDAPADGSVIETQQVSLTGAPDNGTFTLSFLHPEATPADLFGLNEIQQVSISGAPTAGTFTLTFEHPFVSPQDSVESTVTAVTGVVSVNDHSVFANPVPFKIRIGSEILEVTGKDAPNNDLFVNRGILGTTPAQHEIGAVVTEIETTAPIDWDADVADVALALGNLGTLGPTEFSVVGGALPGTPIVVQFIGPLANTPIEELVPDGGLLSGGTLPDANVTTTQEGVSGLGVGPGATTVPLVDVTQMADGQGNPIPLGNPLIVSEQFNIRIDDEEMRVLGVDEVSNTFTVDRGINGTANVAHLIDTKVHYIETTAGIAFDATSADVQSALESLDQVATGDVVASGGDLPGSAVDLEFVGALSFYNVTQLTADGGLLTGGTSPDADVDTTQEGDLSVETALELLDEILDSTELDGEIDNLQESIDVLDASVFDLPDGTPPTLPFTIRVDNEDLKVTAIAGETLTVVRGHNGTQATVHDELSQVKTNVAVTEGDLPDQAVVVEFLGTLEHSNVAPLISDNRFLTEGGVNTPVPNIGAEEAEVTSVIEGALSVETALERLSSIIAPETDINVVGSPLDHPTYGVHVEFRGPVLGSRDITPLYVDAVTDLTGAVTLTTPTPGVLSVQKALVKLVGIQSGDVLVTAPAAGGGAPVALPFLPVQVQFTRQLSATDVPELEGNYIPAVATSTAGIQVTTVEEGQRRTPLEVEFTGRQANVPLPLIVGAINEIPLDRQPDRNPTTTDDLLVQWTPDGEDVIETFWDREFDGLATQQNSVGPDPDIVDDYVCFTDVTAQCETFLTGVNEMQVISHRSLEPDDPDAGSGSYRLTFNGETTPLISVNDVQPGTITDIDIPNTVTPNTIKFHLENLASIGEDNVVVTGGVLRSNIGQTVESYLVEFVNDLANKRLPLIEIEEISSPATTLVTVTRYLGGEEPGTAINAVEIVQGGTSVVTLPYNASADAIQNALDRSGSIARTRGQVDEATNASPVIVTSPAHGLVTGDKIFIEGAAVDGERTRLVDALTNDTIDTFVVEDGDAFTAAVGGGATFHIRIDAEEMEVVGKSGDTLTVLRGANGTLATTHLAKQRVVQILNTDLNKEHEVGVIDADTFELRNPLSGSLHDGDGDYAGGGRWLKLGNVEVEAVPENGNSDLPDARMEITFTGDLSHIDVGDLDADGSGLLGGTNPDAVITTTTQGQGITAGGDYAGGGKWIKNVKLGPAGKNLTVKGTNEIQELSFSEENQPVSGSFTLTFRGATTEAIDYNATAADVEAKLTDEIQVSPIGTENVIVTGGPLPRVPLQIEFVNSLQRINQPELELDGAALGGISSPAGAISTVQEGSGKLYSIGFDGNEEQRIALNNATGGTFAILFGGEAGTTGSVLSTLAIAYDATADDVRMALEDDVATINPGDVIVTGGPLPDFPVDVEFTGLFKNKPMNPLVIDPDPGNTGTPSLSGTSGSVTVLAEGRNVTNRDGEYTLSVLTDDEGPSTVDLLTHQMTQMVDGAGNTLNIGAQNRWVRDSVGAVGTFVPVTPEIQHTAVGVITLNFDEPVSGVDVEDFSLTRDGVAVGLGDLSVISVSPKQYTLDLNLKTGAAGAYELKLLDTDPGTPIRDAAGNVAAEQAVTWDTNITAPTASFAAIATPRNANPGLVTINFSEDVTGVDIADLSLSRDGVDLSLDTLSVVALSASEYTVDLTVAGAADPEGNYELTIHALGSGIMDLAGNSLPNNVSVDWRMDTTAPTADILDVTPDPRTTDADIINVIFDEPVDRTTVDIADFTLTHDGVSVDLPGNGVTVQPEGSEAFLERFTIDLRNVTDPNGTYVLQLTAAGSGIVDEAGSTLVSDAVDNWEKTTVDTTPPTADILDVDPDPRITGVAFVTTTFSEDVTGVDIGDFSLTRDPGSGAVPVDISSLTAIEITPRRYAIDLSGATAEDGDYLLTLNATGSGILDGAGNAVAVDATDDWVKGNTGPTADIVDVTPDPRITPVATVAINFTDPVTGAASGVTGLDVTDFQLRRDGLLLDLSEVTLTAFSDSQYELVLADVTAVDGAYDLTLQADGSGIVRISDSEPFVLGSVESWVTDTVIQVNSTEDLVDATPLGDGLVDADLTLAGQQITLRAALQESNNLDGAGAISLPAGTFTLGLAGTDEDQSATGDLDIRQDLRIVGQGADQTVIDADGLERVFQIFGGVTVHISDVTITGGSVVGSQDGGGIRSGGNLTLENVVVTGNSTLDSGGGINTSGHLSLIGSAVINNSAAKDGGGIRNTGTLIGLNSEFSENSSGVDGGALVNIAQGDAVFNNVTFSGNTSGRDGGAVHNQATLFLNSATIVHNNAENFSGGVSSDVGSQTSIQNSLVAKNSATLNFPDVGGVFATLGNNLIGNNSGADASFPVGSPNVNGDLVGDPSSQVDPLIEDTLENNGGATKTHLLLIDSPAIDAGNNAGLDANVSTEQRGAARVLDGPDLDLTATVDIGAVEFGNFYVNSLDDLTDTTPPGDGLVDGDPLTLGRQITLRAALQEANALAGENTIQLGSEVYTLTMSEPDTVNPTADIVDIDPDPRDVPVGVVTINFSEDVLNVDLSDGVPGFILTRTDLSGQQVVSLAGLALSEISNSEYTLDLSTVTDVDGIYTLTLDAAATSINDLVGNPLVDDATDGWRIGPDVYPPTADIVDVTPDPRSTDADPITINFSEPVVGVDLADFTLELDLGGGLGPQNIPLGNSTLQQLTTSQYVLTFEPQMTTPLGTYTVSLVANGSGIQDFAANDFATDATDSWEKGVDSVAPTADIVDVTPDPRITNVGLVTIDFLESVTGVDISDFSLTRDRGNGAVSVSLAAVVLTQVTPMQYTLNMNAVTGVDADYVLTLVATGSGIQDVATNLMVTDAVETWTRGEASDGAGDLDITDTSGGLTVVGAGSGNTVIDANGIDRAFQVLENVSATLRNLTVTGGAVTGSSEGGAASNSGTLFLSGVTISGNTSQGSGGGLYNTLGGSLTIDESDVSGNTAFDGGGIYNNDDGALAVRNSVVHDNVASNDGGGVYNDLDGDLDLINSDLIRNTAVGQGGGVYNNDAANLTVSNSRFSVNAAEDGGAIFNELVSVLTIGNTSFSANEASDDGGAIYNDDGLVVSTRNIYSGNIAADGGGVLFNASNGNVTLDGDSLALNEAGGRGGAADNFGTLSLDGTTITSNTAVDGGAIASARQLDVTGTVFSGNVALSRGGGLFNDDVGVVNVVSTQFVSNNSGGDGGGIFVTDNSDATFSFVTVQGNESVGDGGGVFNATETAFAMTESLLVGNVAEGDGGGFYNSDAGDAVVANVTMGQNIASNGGGIANTGNLELTHSTVYENSAETDGGGISNTPTVPDKLSIRNTIVARNTSPAAADLVGTLFQSDGHNLIGDAGGVTFAGSGDQSGDTASPLDPSLFDLKFNGGPTQTHGLQFGSPARDAGDNSDAPVTDQRGFTRIFDGDGDGTSTIDIGALESGFVVNSFEDTIDVSPDDGISADSDGNSSLRAAINEANASPGGDTIILPAGTFLLSLTGRDEDGGFTGDLDISGDLDILGAGSGETLIDADGIDRVFHVHNGVTLNVFGVTINGGDAGSTGSGGGLLSHGTVSLNETVVTDNVANRGGGVFTSGELTVSNSTVSNNDASLQGGGIYNFLTGAIDGAIGAGDLTLRIGDGTSFPTSGSFNVLIDTEELSVTSVDGDLFTVTRGVNGTTAAAHPDGAAVELVGGGVVTVEQSTVTGNQANAQGAGLYNEASLAIRSSEIVQNVSDSRGGGIYNATLTAVLANPVLASSTTIDLVDAASIPAAAPFDIFVGGEGMAVTGVNGNQFTVVRGVSGTVAAPHGAGAEVRLAGKAFASIDRSTVAENTAGSAGGGIFSEDTLTITTSTVSSNTAGAGAGLASNGSVTVVNSTVASNVAVNAGGVAADGGRFELKNTIVAANTATGEAADVRGRFISVGNNLIGDAGDSVGLEHGVNSDQVGSAGSPYDPVMDLSLKDNGGPTRTHRLLPSSPAIDAADNTGSDETTDQRGAVRPTNQDADIGAFERTLLSLLANGASVVEGATGAQPVNVSVILSNPSVESISVDYTTVDGTAFQGSDYQSTSGTLTFEPGELTKNIVVMVNGDLSVESTETFFVELSGAGEAELANSQAIVTIVNDDTAVSVDDVSVIETDAGTVDMVFTVSLVQTIDAITTITVDYATADGTATGAGASPDYVPVSGQLTFSDPTDPTQLSQTVVVTINGDTTVEPDETVLLSIPTASVNITDGEGEGTILNDDSAFTVTNPTVVEGNFGVADLDFVVSLVHPSADVVTVDYSTSNGNEIQQVSLSGGPTGGDFTLTYDAQTTGVIASNADAAAVQAALEGLSNIGIGDVAVTGGDLPSAGVLVEFVGTLAGTDVSELQLGSNNLTGGTAPTVDISTSIGAAVAGEDYDAASGTVTFQPGETNQTVTVTVNGDVLLEPDEELLLTLANATSDGVANGLADLNGGVPAVGTIDDDEVPPDVWEIVQVDDAGTPTIEVFLNDTLFTSTTDFVNELSVTGDFTGVKDDLFIVDFAGGAPIPTAGLVLDGQGQDGADVVQLRNPTAGFAAVDYSITGDAEATISLDGANVRFVGMEAVVDNTPSADRSFVLDSGFTGNHEMRTANASGVGNSLFSSAGASTFAVFAFENPSNSLVFNAGPGDNTFTLVAMDSALAATVTVNAGDGDDIVDAATYPNPLTINGDDGNDLLGGGVGNDTVNGGEGNDSPGGGQGDDVLIGGAGTDIVTESLDADYQLTDTQLVTILVAGGGTETDTLSGIEQAALTGGDSSNSIDASGFGGSVTLSGAGGDDTMVGSAGDDQFDGGSGNDRIVQTSDAAQKLSDTAIEIGTWPSGGVFTSTATDGFTSVEEIVMNGGDADNVIHAGSYTLGDVTIDGADGNDTLTGGRLHDLIIGGEGDDKLNAKRGDDSLEGGEGNDTLLGGFGDDTAIGGAGADFINANTGDDLVDGGDGNDRLRGGEGADTITGGAGDDELNENLAVGTLILDDTSLGGDLGDKELSGIESAVLNGKVGADVDQGENFFSATMATIPVTMIGGKGNDTMIGGQAADFLNGNGGNDRLDGDLGNDSIQGGAGKDFVVGGEGNDTLEGQGANDTLRGGPGDDNLDGGANGFDRVFETGDADIAIDDTQMTGGFGTDVISNFEEVKFSGGSGDNDFDASGFSGRAVLWGGPGDDTLTGTGNADRINGGPGNDSLVGGGASDTMFGGSGNDTLEGDGGNDVLYGQRDDDSLKGGVGEDSILGDGGDDTINGGDGNDTLRGGAGADRLSGWIGDDVLNGNSGRDILVGGTGDDRLFGGSDRDTILGEDGDDFIKGQSDEDVLSGGTGDDKGVDFAVSAMGNLPIEIDEEFEFYDTWIDNV